MQSKPFIARAAIEKVILTEEQIALVSGGTDGPPTPPTTGNKLTFTPTWQDNSPDHTRSDND